jgi:uncharacterized membrane protein
VAGFLLGYVVKRTDDWIVALWASRCAMLIAFVPLVWIRRADLSRIKRAGAVGIAAAIAAGVTDILGVTTYSAGAEQGYLSILLAASAVFPIIAVALSYVFLDERLAMNQYLGIVLVVAGLLLLGVGG